MSSRSSDTRRRRASMRCDGLEKSSRPGPEGGRKRKLFRAEGETNLDRQALSCGFAGTLSCFGQAYRPLVQLPRLNGFLTSFSRQIRIQLSLRFVEGVFRGHSGPVGCVIRFFDLLSEESNLRINGLRCGFALAARSSATCFRRFVGGFHVTAPARLNRLVQFVQGGIGFVCSLSYSALFKQPPENRPVH